MFKRLLLLSACTLSLSVVATGADIEQGFQELQTAGQQRSEHQQQPLLGTQPQRNNKKYCEIVTRLALVATGCTVFIVGTYQDNKGAMSAGFLTTALGLGIKR